MDFFSELDTLFGVAEGFVEAEGVRAGRFRVDVEGGEVHYFCPFLDHVHKGGADAAAAVIASHAEFVDIHPGFFSEGMSVGPDVADEFVRFKSAVGDAGLVGEVSNQISDFFISLIEGIMVEAGAGLHIIIVELRELAAVMAGGVGG